MIADDPGIERLHEELLDAINAAVDDYTIPETWAAAIRAVVQLHRPVDEYAGHGQPSWACRGDHGSSLRWPCRTIGAVTAALGMETPGVTEEQ